MLTEHDKKEIDALILLKEEYKKMKKLSKEERIKIILKAWRNEKW